LHVAYCHVTTRYQVVQKLTHCTVGMWV